MGMAASDWLSECDALWRGRGCGSTRATGLDLIFIIADANSSVRSVSRTLERAGEMQATKRVRADPPSESISSLVSVPVRP